MKRSCPSTTRLVPAGSSRREFMALAAASIASPSLAAKREALSLSAAARAAGLSFGSSIAAEALEFRSYGRLFASEAGVVTTDYALKFDALRPTPDRIEFGQADDLLDFATRHGLMFRGHALIWNENAPDWLKRRPASEIGRILDSHIDQVVGRYAGRVQSWDVVNEPFWPDHGSPGGFRRGPWFDALGPAYVARAFRRAAAADRRAKLVLNEAFTERDDTLGRNVRTRLLALVTELKQAGVPLHVVGLQGHLQPQYAADDQAFLAFLEALAKLDVEIYITELDCDDIAFPDDVATRDRMVAERYESFLTTVLKVPAVKMVVTWQLSDRFSWYRSREVMEARHMKRAPRPLPFDDLLEAKPARDAMLRAFASRQV